ncbi:MAG: tyrosine--tRNA ligase [archaeon]
MKREELIKRNVLEIIGDLPTKKSPIAYCGYEPSGPLHLGHFVTILKLKDLQQAGYKIKILLADIHAFLNRKGDEKQIAKEVLAWKKTIKAIGLKAEVVLGSSFQFKPEYQKDVLMLSQESTIQRGLRSMQQIARDVDHATISQLLYPLMQVVDIKHLKIDVAVGGMEQRKVHMIGKDLKKILNYDFTALHTPLITSLKGPGEKMSKSIPGSGISVTDSNNEIEKTIKGAYCPAKIAKENPILQITELIIFPLLNKIKIIRPEKFGGNLEFNSYSDLEKTYLQGKLHPLDLKQAVIESLEKIIAPIRKNFK